MPGLNGLETSRTIKGKGGLNHIHRIVIITAFDQEEIRAQAEELMLDGMLQKPSANRCSLTL
jgi:CheY-like chemotaxis protein